MKYAQGQLVVCVKTHDRRFSFLCGAVGEVLGPAPFPLDLLTGNDYMVNFPAYVDVTCPHCGRTHKSFPMAHDELKPLEDPDKDEATPRVEKKPETIGFITT